MLGVSGFAEKVSVRDSTGVQIHFTSSPKRIVTLAPSLGETVFTLLGKEHLRLVGVTENSSYPTELKKRSSVGFYHRLNLSAIAALRPDLILATQNGNPPDQVKHLRELGLPVVVVQTSSMDTLLKSSLLIARILRKEKEGLNQVQKIQKALIEFQKANQNRSLRKKVLVQLDQNPLIVAGGASFFNEALKWVGAENLYSDLPQGFPRPSVEDVIQRKPDVILVVSFGKEKTPFLKMAEFWKKFKVLPAVKSQQIYIDDLTEITSPTFRVLKGLEKLQKLIYPESKR